MDVSQQVTYCITVSIKAEKERDKVSAPLKYCKTTGSNWRHILTVGKINIG